MTSKRINEKLPKELALVLAADAQKDLDRVAGIGWPCQRVSGNGEAEFRAAATGHGLILPDNIRADSRLQRCPTEDRPGRRDGAFLLRPDGSGGFQNHLGGEGWQNFFPRNPRRPSKADRTRHERQIKAARKAREAEDAAKHAKAADLAAFLWKHAPIADDTHPYLRRKGVRSYGLRLSRDGALIVPAYDSNSQITTLEFIYAQGTKRFLGGGKKAGAGFAIGAFPDESSVSGTICIGEGYATCASVHEATGYPVVVAFDCGNLLPVAKVLRAKYPHANITIAADDDSHRPENPGLCHANEAARAVGGKVAKPDFGRCAKGRKSRGS